MNPQRVATTPGLLARALMALVRAYRLLLSPWLGASCRFEPTCSVYALQALQRHGALAGTYLGAARLMRCHPWCAGGADAVPDAPPALFARFSGKSPSSLTPRP